jgi:lysyl-tRNA synthetase class 2
VVTTSGVRAPVEAPGRERPQWRPRVPWLVALVVRLAAVFAVLDILHPAGRPRSESRALNGMVNGSIFAAAVFAAGAMLVLATGLEHRKRRAWVLAVAAVVLGIATHVPVHRWPVVAVNVAVLILLLLARHDFTAISERTGRVAALRVFLVMSGVSIVAGLFLTSRTAPNSPLGSRLVEVLAGLVGFSPDLEFRAPNASAITEIALNTLGALTALLTLLSLLAPARKPSRLAPEAEQRLRGLLDRFGARDSLGYFALRGDKTAIFSPSGKAAVVYRVVGSVTLAAGDPLGDPEAWPGAIQAWLDEAEDYAWTPGVVGASEDAAIAYHRAGFDSLELGDEAVLHLDEFNLEGRSMRGVRQGVNRVRRAGYTVDVRRQRDLAPEELEEARATAEALRGEDVERGFSMALGRLGAPADPELVVARARDGSGRLVAVLTFVPWGRDGLSLDLMRRAHESENGTVEFVIVGVAEQARGLGVRRISLNFAVFRSVFERGARVGAGPVLRLWHRVLLVASRWWQIESLYRANAKYQPEWVPRFVCFRRAGELPRVGLAALEAEAFVQFPHLRWLAH